MKILFFQILLFHQQMKWGYFHILNLLKKQFVDISEFQPKYLKDFGGQKN